MSISHDRLSSLSRRIIAKIKVVIINIKATLIFMSTIIKVILPR